MHPYPSVLRSLDRPVFIYAASTVDVTDGSAFAGTKIEAGGIIIRLKVSGRSGPDLN